MRRVVALLLALPQANLVPWCSMMFHVCQRYSCCPWSCRLGCSSQCGHWHIVCDMVASKMAADQRWMSSDVQANAAVSKDAVASLQSFHSASPVLWIWQHETGFCRRDDTASSSSHTNPVALSGFSLVLTLDSKLIGIGMSAKKWSCSLNVCAQLSLQIRKTSEDLWNLANRGSIPIQPWLGLQVPGLWTSSGRGSVLWPPRKATALQQNRS